LHAFNTSDASATRVRDDTDMKNEEGADGSPQEHGGSGLQATARARIFPAASVESAASPVSVM